jgi:hypothetical protein
MFPVHAIRLVERSSCVSTLSKPRHSMGVTAICTSQTLYSWKEPLHHLSRRQGGSQDWPGYCDEEKNILLLQGIKHPAVQLVALMKRTSQCYLLQR